MEIGDLAREGMEEDRIDLPHGTYEMVTLITNPASKHLPKFIFSVDVSSDSYSLGIPQMAFTAIHAAVSGGLLHDSPDTPFSIICYDTHVHLVRIVPGSSRPQIIRMAGSFDKIPIKPADLFTSLTQLKSTGDMKAVDSILNIHEAFWRDEIPVEINKIKPLICVKSAIVVAQKYHLSLQ